MGNATINYKTPLLASTLGINYWYFLYFPLHANFVNMAEAAHITSTVRPPRSPQSARTSQKHVFATSACFDTGHMVEVRRREECSIDVRLNNTRTNVRLARTPQSARTSQKHARGSSACFDTGRWVGTAEVKWQIYM